MSQIYSSSSGSYSNYLAERQNDKIAEVINAQTKAINTQTAMNLSAAAHIETSLKQEMRQMSTGIKTSIDKNTYALVASANMLQTTFREGFDSINNTLDLGFTGISMDIGHMTSAMTAGFSNLSEKMDNWGTEICEKLDAIHDIVNNPLLTASRELYRRAATNASKKFYEEALEDIKGAVEKNKTDFISWGLMGKIYLFGMSEFSNVVDVPKAVESFTNACKYISPDIDESEEARKMASEFYFYLGYANYVLANESKLKGKNEEQKNYLETCIKNNKRSYDLSNDMLESHYNEARAHSLMGEKDKALECLKEIMTKDAFYSLKALDDYDFSTMKEDVFELIKKLRDELYSSFKGYLDTLSNDYYYFDTPYAKKVLNIINSPEVKEISPESPYLEVFNKNIELIEVYNVIKSRDIPFDLEVTSLTISGKNTINTSFLPIVYKGIILPWYSFHDEFRQNTLYYGDYGIKQIANPDEYENTEDRFFGYTFLPTEYGKGDIVLKYTDIVSEGLEISIDNLNKKTGLNCKKTEYIHDKREFQIDDYTIMEFEILEKNGTVYNDLDGRTTTGLPSKARFTVRQKGIIEKSKMKKQNEEFSKTRIKIEEQKKTNLVEKEKKIKTCINNYSKLKKMAIIFAIIIEALLFVLLPLSRVMTHGIVRTIIIVLFAIIGVFAINLYLLKLKLNKDNFQKTNFFDDDSLGGAIAGAILGLILSFIIYLPFYVVIAIWSLLNLIFLIIVILGGKGFLDFEIRQIERLTKNN